MLLGGALEGDEEGMCFLPFFRLEGAVSCLKWELHDSVGFINLAVRVYMFYRRVKGEKGPEGRAREAQVCNSILLLSRHRE